MIFYYHLFYCRGIHLDENNLLNFIQEEGKMKIKYLVFTLGLVFIILCFTSVQAEMQESKMQIGEKIQQMRDLFQPGQAKIIKDAQGNVNIRLQKLHFDFGQSMVKSEYYPMLDKVFQAARMYPNHKIRITGYTDSVGDNEFNKQLSLQRVKSVAQYMINKHGVQPDQIETIGAGESNPIASNETMEGRKMNRRIEFTLVPQ